MGAIDGLSPGLQIEAVYVGYFGRGADSGGLAYWELGLLNNTNTLSGIAASFFVQVETIALYQFAADYNNGVRTFTNAEIEAFISAVYQLAFNRAPDTAGLAYWTANLQANLGNPNSVGAFIVDVLNGAQNIPGGTQDSTTINNKITVAGDFSTRTGNAGRGTAPPLTTNFKAAAVNCIVPVTNVAGTIVIGEAVTTTYLAGPA